MNKSFLRIAGMMMMVVLALPLQAQEFAKVDKSPADIVLFRADGVPQIKVVYSRPAKRDRDIFGELIPFDQVWRTGANEATEIRLYKDAKVNGQELKAGIYSLFTIPKEDTWTIIFSKQTDVWGAYQYDEAQDVIRVDVPATMAEDSLELFGIAFQPMDESVHMVLGWDKTRVAIPFVL
jgi:hypothetical protein